MKQVLDKQILTKWREAGRIAAECREWARENVKPGVRLAHILETVEGMMRERGAEPAFPAQTSRNHVAAHYCSPPGDEQVYEEGDCVKIDFGVHVTRLGWRSGHRSWPRLADVEPIAPPDQGQSHQLRHV